MTTTSKNTTHTSGVAILTTLRALAAGPPGSIADALTTAERQATQLRGLLANQFEQLPTSLAGLIPSVIVERINNVPVPGISFWGNGRWHIHIRASDPIDVQDFTTLHELKHIIDHPLRRRASEFSDADWEALANRFAMRALSRSARPIVASDRARIAYE